MAEDSRGTPTITHTSAFSRTAKHTARVCTLGTMGRSTMVSGIRALSMATASGEASLETPISVSGATQRPRGMAYILGRTVIAMKASGSSVSSMGREQIFSRTETPTRESTSMGSQMARASTPGRTGLSM